MRECDAPLDGPPAAFYRPRTANVALHVAGAVAILAVDDAARLHQSLGEALLIARGAHPAQTGSAAVDGAAPGDCPSPQPLPKWGGVL